MKLLKNTRVKYFLKKLLKYSFAYKKIKKELNESQNYTSEQIEELQNKKLQKLVKHCYKNVPYYRELFDKLGLKPNDIKTKYDLQKLPFLDKYTVQKNNKKLTAKNCNPLFSYKTQTSGTTGTPSIIIWDKKSLDYEYATVERFYKNINTKNNKKITLRGALIKPVDDKKPPFWEFNKSNNELVLSTYHLTKKTAPLYIEKIKEFAPSILIAHPSTAIVLAKYLKEQNQKLELDVVFTSSEELMPDQKDFIEGSFKCPIYDWYGQVERVAAMGQCKYGNYHIQEDYSIVELLDTEEPHIKEVVGTHLHNYSMPLLRYKTYDTVKIDTSTHCPCGSQSRAVSKIYGKNANCHTFITNEGEKTTSLVYIPRGVKNIIETQCVQENINELIINVTTTEDFSESDKNKLIENVKERISKDVKVIINEVDEIPRGPNGKFLAAINKLTEKNQNV